MKKWEYKAVAESAVDLDTIGNQGWELVCYYRERAIFKREQLESVTMPLCPCGSGLTIDKCKVENSVPADTSTESAKPLHPGATR